MWELYGDSTVLILSGFHVSWCFHQTLPATGYLSILKHGHLEGFNVSCTLPLPKFNSFKTPTLWFTLWKNHMTFLNHPGSFFCLICFLIKRVDNNEVHDWQKAEEIQEIYAYKIKFILLLFDDLFNRKCCREACNKLPLSGFIWFDQLRLFNLWGSLKNECYIISKQSHENMIAALIYHTENIKDIYSCNTGLMSILSK